MGTGFTIPQGSIDGVGTGTCTTCTGATTLTVTLTTQATNDLLVLIVADHIETGGPLTAANVGDSFTLTWTLTDTVTQTPAAGGCIGVCSLYVFTAPTGSHTGTDTITVSYGAISSSAASGLAFGIPEYFSAGAIIVNQATSAGTLGTTPSISVTPSGTGGAAHWLLVGAAFIMANTAVTPGAGFTKVSNPVVNSLSTEAYGESESTTSSSPQSVPLSWVTAANWDLIALAVPLNAPLAVTISPSSPTVDLGQTVTFTATATGGSGSFSTYAWSQSSSNLGCTFTNSPSITCTPTVTATYTPGVSVVVTDSNGVVSPTSSQAVTVNPALATAGAPTISTALIDVGQTPIAATDTLPAALDGSGTVTYTWLASITGSAGTYTSGNAAAICTTATGTATNSLVVNCVALAGATVGTYWFKIQLTDSATTPTSTTSPASASSTTVNADPITSQPTPSSPILDAGQSMTFSTTPSLGSGSYTTFTWSESSSNLGCVLANSASIVCTPTSIAGEPFTLMVKVTDSLGWTSVYSTPATITVYSALIPPGITSVSSPVDSGQTVTVAFSPPSGGTGSGNFECSLLFSTNPAGPYSFKPGSTCGASTATFTASTGSTITYYYEVQVTDKGTTAPYATSTSSSLSGVMNPVLVKPGIAVNGPTFDLGQSVTLTTPTAFSGGSPTYTCQWFENVNGMGYGNLGSSFPCTVTDHPTTMAVLGATGTFSFELQVTDSNQPTGITVTSSPPVSVTVNPALVAGAVSPGSPIYDVGQVATLTSHPIVGTTPYSYQWYSSASGTGACDSGSLISLATGATYNAPTASTGTTYYCYVVTDSSTTPASTGSAWDLVTVNSAPSVSISTPTSPVTMDQDQMVTVTANAAVPGTGGFSYAWTVVGSCPGFVVPGNVLSFVYSPSSITASCAFKVTATDLGTTIPDLSATATTAAISVNLAPSITITAPTSTVTMDQDQFLEVTASVAIGGTGPFSYAWTVVGSCPGFSSPGNIDSFLYFPSGTTASCAFTVTATDTGTTVPDSSATATSAPITVNPAPSIAISTPTSPVSIVVAEQITVTAYAAVPGTGPSFSYAWTVVGSCPGFSAPGNVLNFAYTPTATSSSCAFQVHATDLGTTVPDLSATAVTATITVNAASATYSEVTATLTNTQPYALPGAEEFTIGASNLMVDSISVYLAGTGTADVSIGTTLWGTDVVSSIPISVDGAGWYPVSFPAVMLSGNTNYYLNVQSEALGVTWGFTASPSTEVNALQDYYYVGAVLTHDDATPNLYMIGVYFTQAYTVTFSQTGLTSGSWSATLGPTTLSAAYTSNIVFTVPNGVYPFTMPTVLGFSATPSSGTITVSGAPMAQAIAYAPVPTYAVTFSQTGLTGGSWSVTLGPTTLSAAFGSHIVFNVPDGTYPFQVIAVLGFAASPTSGVISVSGGPPATQAILFSTMANSFTGSPLSGPVASAVVLTGFGYAGDTSYGASFNGVAVLTPTGACTDGSASPGPQTFTTDANGAFSCTFMVPSVTPGSYELTAGPVIGPEHFTVTAPTPTEYSYVTATGPNTQYYALPGAEEFTAGGSTVTANYASVWLTGTGSVTVAIGTAVFGSDVVSPITVNVAGPGWYTVTFSAVLTSGTNYYLNVHLVSGSVLWGYTVSPATALNELQDYYLVSNVLTQDNASPNLYVVGYQAVG